MQVVIWVDRHLMLTPTDWGDLLSNKIITRSAYIAISIGFGLLFINDFPYLSFDEFGIQNLYTVTIFITLSFLATGIFFKKYYAIPISILIFNISFIFTNLYQTFEIGSQIKTITVCHSIVYFIINAIIFRLFTVFVINLTVFFVVFICAVHALLAAKSTGGLPVQPFMLNAVALSAAGLLLQHLVLTVRGMLIEQLGSIRLKMAELEAEMEIESARREAREKAVQLNRISVVEALGASIAHEINQPIAAALIYSRAARNWAEIECQDAPETLRAVDGVERSVDRAARLIDNIRLLTTKRNRSYELTDVREIVKDQANLVQAEFEKRGIKLRLEPPASETTASVCAPEIALATINLLRNAMEAFDEPAEGGMVSVDCRRTGSDWIEILVIDNGKGLAPEALRKAFDAFHSTKEAGAGIGLSICQEVAEHHAGSISLTANAESGMTATLRLAGKLDDI